MVDFKTLNWKKFFFSFQGRVGRLLVVVYILLSLMIGLGAEALPNDLPLFLTLPLALIIYVVMTWVGIAFGVKRFHDMGKSGWFAWLYMIPVVNVGIMIWQCVAEGDNSPNQYGPPPATF